MQHRHNLESSRMRPAYGQPELTGACGETLTTQRGVTASTACWECVIVVVYVSPRHVEEKEKKEGTKSGLHTDT